MLKFRTGYFIFALIIFFTELFIGLYIHDGIIRPYIGDFLVVILIYCFIKSFFNFPVFSTAVFVLLFAYTVEISQYFKIIDKLGLQNYKLARVIMGTTFEWTDMLVYTLGIGLVLIIEKFIIGNSLLASSNSSLTSK